MDENIQTVLLNISEDLSDENISAMVFLCGKKLKETEKEKIEDGKMLFSAMKKKGFLLKDNFLFLKELLSKIGRKDILTGELKTTETEMEELEHSFQHVSSYRFLLYDISVNLTSEETEKMMFLLEDDIKYIHKLNKAKCMMVVLSEMEKQRKLSEDNLQVLNNYLKNISRLDLCERIKKFENEQYNRRLDVDAEFQKMAVHDNDVNDSSIQAKTQNDSSLKENPLKQYKLDKDPHGLCIILNNHNFCEARKNKIKMQDRNGTHQDAEVIYRIFTARGYKVKVHHDLTGEQMLNIMKTYAKDDHTEKDSFVCFVLSHGDKGIVFGTDGKDVTVKDLTGLFNGLNCPSLVEKPKVFFIQACQGNKSDTGVPYVSDSNESGYENDTKCPTLPITADFLTAFASVEDYESFRRPKNGSVYIQNLCTVLQDHQFFKTDLTDILTKVHEKIADEVYEVEQINLKQMPTYQSQLRKTLILPPPSNGQQESGLPHI